MARDPLSYLGIDPTLQPETITATRAPTTSDIYDVGVTWINTSSNAAYICTSSGHWESTGSGTAQVATLTGDAGGAISPVAGDIVLAGAGAASTSGAGNTITITVPTGDETTVGCYERATTAEVVAGTDTTRAITTAGLTAKLGTQTDHGVLVASGTAAAIDALTVGTNGQVLVGSTSADPVFASIASSDSSITVAAGAGTLGLTVVQATEAQHGGGMVATAAETIAGVNDTHFLTPAKAALLPVGVAASEAAAGVSEYANTAETTAYTDNTRTITCLHLGEAFATPPAIGTGTPAAGTFTSLTSGGATSLQAGQVDIATDAAANAVNIGLGAVARAIAIGSSAAAHTITIGSTTGAASLDLACGTGNFTLDGAVTSNITVGTSLTTGVITIGGTSQTGTLTLGSSAGAQTTAIGAGAGVSTVNIANGIGGNTVSIGNGANSAAQTINIAGGASAANSTVNILSGNGTAGTQTLNALTGTRAGAVNIGTGAAAHTVIIGSTNGTAATTIQSGTGDLALTSTDDITVDCAGVLELNSTAGIIGIGSDADAFDINLGTGAAARTITIGNVTAATAVNINTGTGGMLISTTGAGDFAVNSADTVLIDAAGVLELNSSAGIISIGNDAISQNINLGTAGARVIAIGNTTGATQVTITSGTGNVDIASTGAGDITLDSSDTVLIDAAGVLELNSSAGIIGIGNDAIAQNINLGTGAAARTITIGNVTDATAVNLNAGTGGLGFTSTGAGAITFTTSAGGFSVNGAGNAINIGTDAVQNITTIGNITGTTAVDINSGTGGVDIVSTGTGDITLDSADTVLIDAAGVLELNSSAGIISIGNDNIAQNINVGTGAAARVITIGNVTDATQVVLNSGTAGVAINTTGAGDFVVTSADTVLIDAAGVLELNSSAGVIGIGNDAVAQAINVGTGAAARTITIGNATAATSVVINNGTGALNVGSNATDHDTTVGSTTGASTTTIQSGTGGLVFTGTAQELTAKYVTRSGDKITFTQSPILQSNLNTGAAPTGATGDVNLMSCQEGILMEQFILGAGQTIIAPRMDANGLLISLDLTDDEGAEFNFGAARANSRHAYTIGTDPAFYMSASFKVADVSGVDPLLFGFRKSAANAADFTTYTDFASIGLDAGVNVGTAILQTNLNNAGVATTNTTDVWGDGESHSIAVYVSAAGVVTYTFDGGAPSVTAAFTFDNGDVVVPFVHFLHATVAPGEIQWVSFEVGPQ